MYVELNWFHVLNPDEVKQGGKPSVMQVGPYCFLETRIKQEVFPIGVEHINYGTYMEYNYNQEQTEARNCIPPPGTGSSVCSENDQLTLLNMVMASVVGAIPLETGNPITDNVIDNFLNNLNTALMGQATDCTDCEDDIITVDSVVKHPLRWFQSRNAESREMGAGEHEWHWVRNPDYISQLCNQYDCRRPILDIIGIDIEDIPETLALLAGANGTIGSYYTINHGRFDPHLVLDIYKYNGMTELPESWWPRAPSRPLRL